MQAPSSAVIIGGVVVVTACMSSTSLALALANRKRGSEDYIHRRVMGKPYVIAARELMTQWGVPDVKVVRRGDTETSGGEVANRSQTVVLVVDDAGVVVGGGRAAYTRLRHGGFITVYQSPP